MYIYERSGKKPFKSNAVSVTGLRYYFYFYLSNYTIDYFCLCETVVRFDRRKSVFAEQLHQHSAAIIVIILYIIYTVHLFVFEINSRVYYLFELHLGKYTVSSVPTEKSVHFNLNLFS